MAGFEIRPLGMASWDAFAGFACVRPTGRRDCEIPRSGA